MFNDTFTGNDVNVTWSVHRESPEGPRIAGSTFQANVPMGTHVTHTITFTPPSDSGSIYLVLSSAKAGGPTLFSDDDTKFAVS